MARFITGNELNFEIEKVFKEAQEEIFLVSPYIKLHPRIEAVLGLKKDQPEVALRILFGKNLDNPSLSMRPGDLAFFKEFPNVEIRYHEDLHAKYYANELDGILTSMNLHSFSQNNNVEFGVLLKVNLMNAITNSGDSRLDQDAKDTFEEVFGDSELLFRRTPVFDSSLFGLKQTYKYSKIQADITEEFFGSQISGYRKPVSQPIRTKPTGYCIRTGKPIVFNPERPMSIEAFQSWSKFSNADYPEKFCHFSGEASNGETSFNKPILKKNWTNAKVVHGF